MHRNQLITVHEHDLLTLLSHMLLFSKRSAGVIDCSEKSNGWLNLELQCPYVIERLSKIIANFYICCKDERKS